MLVRLANVVYWACCGLAVAILSVGVRVSILPVAPAEDVQLTAGAAATGNVDYFSRITRPPEGAPKDTQASAPWERRYDLQAAPAASRFDAILATIAIGGAALTWLFGLAFRYVLAGPASQAPLDPRNRRDPR
jgi:hypothetical protein